MNLKDRLFENWRAKVLGASVTAIVGVSFWALPFTRGLTHLSYDMPFAFRGAIRPEEALVVFMNDDSRSRLKQTGQGPWDRALHLQLLNELFALGAKEVVFDVLFDFPWTNRAVDTSFAAAIKSHGHVVLGASFSYHGDDGGGIVTAYLGDDGGPIVTTPPLHPIEPLGSAAPWGVADFPRESDDVIRRHYCNEHYTNLAWQTAVVAGIAMVEPEKPRWINFYGPPGAIRNVSYWKVLESGMVAPEMISNKVVFVGIAPSITYAGSDHPDEYATPFTRWTGARSTGVEIHATAFLNLARGDWLERLPLPVELGMILAAAFGLAILLPLFRPGTAIVIAAGCSFAVAAGAVFLAQQLHWWFCWGAISIVESSAALIWLKISRLNRSAADRRSLAALEVETEEPLAEGRPRIPEHEVLRPLAKGGYGQVWLARNALGTLRAVKIVTRSDFEDEQPFEREFRGIKAFEPVSRSHEGFVHILQVGRREKAGYFYCVMELADDRNPTPEVSADNYAPKTLSSELARLGRLPCEECVQIGLRLAGALHCLHSAGLVHRDIKPSNIIFVKGVPKLADIGLVVALREAASFVGTEGFVPPEGPGTYHADIYSLGKVLYEMAMGRGSGRFPELPSILPPEPELERLRTLNEIILKACEKNLSRRYSSAKKMHDALERLAKRFKTADKGG